MYCFFKNLLGFITVHFVIVQGHGPGHPKYIANFEAVFLWTFLLSTNPAIMSGDVLQIQ